MAKDARVIVDMECTKCKKHRLQTEKRVKGENVPKRLELTKYCKTCDRHTTFKESK